MSVSKIPWHTLFIGVVQDSVETALSRSGDVFFTATAEEFGGEGDGIRAAIVNRLKFKENGIVTDWFLCDDPVR